MIYVLVALIGLLSPAPPAEPCAHYVEIHLDPEKRTRANEVDLGKAMGELVRVDVEPCLPMVFQALKEGDQETRRTAANLLWLLPMVSTEKDDLLEMGELLRSHTEQLLPYVQDPDAKVRVAILGATSYMQPAPPPEALEPVLGALNDPDSEVREAAVAVLGAFRSSPKLVIERLMSLIRNQTSLEYEALGSLENLLSHGYADLLTEVDLQVLINRASSRDNVAIQGRAITALGSLSDPPAEVLTRLEEIAADPQAAEHIRNNARSYLKRQRKHE